MKKHVIITGGAQGIGKHLVLELLSENYAVSVFEIDIEAIAEFQKEIPQEMVQIYHVDVSDEESVKAAIYKSMDKHRNIYALVNNAGISINKNLTDLSLDEWNKVIGTNLTGAFLCSKYATPFMKLKGGRIVNMASTRALQSESNTEAYSASKGGILALTHALATSLGPEIKVNAISPGWIDVSAVKKSSVANQDKLTKEDHAQHPAGRVGKASDIASMVLFLLQPENDFITGQNFVIDGGMTKKMIYV
ncbi:SDR family oxidoreductase [Draconibacterium sp. IB214405]|uniref:SDR family oxidoreductase n=1 Tax=Draconibacterium sp. IB214405 TaxID=3097352 RepID=UPI002A0B9C10|nr:SDR family oxidoreductase [Draconibacterium sp. IB214405]MDX8338731.1 SDR family oxidoreductase [Draconibacterium sp. IB214405]